MSQVPPRPVLFTPQSTAFSSAEWESFTSGTVQQSPPLYVTKALGKLVKLRKVAPTHLLEKLALDRPPHF